MSAKNRWKADLTLSARNCNHVVKARYRKNRRRFRIEENEVKYSVLLRSLRDKFELPLAAKLVLKYADKDGDLVIMANDVDLKDALVTQALNPLRLYVSITGNCQRNKPNASLLNGGCNCSHVVKAKYRNFLCLIRIGPNEVNFSLLQSKIRESFKLPPTIRWILKYKDKDGDLVLLANDEDLKDALVMQSLNPLRLEILVTENRGRNKRPVGYSNQENDTERVVHHGVICEGCNSNPLEGPRFKSSRMFCYDLCHKCLIGSGANPADFVKIEKSFYDPDAQQTPPAIDPTNRGEVNFRDCGVNSDIHTAGESSGSKSNEDNSEEDTSAWASLLNHHRRDSISEWVVDPPPFEGWFVDGEPKVETVPPV